MQTKFGCSSSPCPKPRKGRATRAPSPKTRLSLEQLERREVPTISFNAATGVVFIEGTDHRDVANVSVVSGQVKVQLTTYQEGASVGIGQSINYGFGSVEKIRFYGYEGDDRFTNDTAIPSWAVGHEGNDELKGGSSDDWLGGGDDDDALDGRSGNDTVLGGSGDDEIDGGSGQDLLYGGTENDTIHGGSGNDTFYGEGGADVLHGDSGLDALHGGSGDDALYGGSGDDDMYGEDGRDLLVSIGGGTDMLSGGSGLDSFWMDSTDVLTDDVLEDLLKRVHRVNQFVPLSYGGWAFPPSKELNGQDLIDPIRTFDLAAPPASKEDFKDKPLFASGGPSKNDIFQHGVGDCYFASLISAIAKVEPDSYIRQMVADLGDGTYAVRFYRNGQPEYVRVDADLWVNSPGVPMFAKLGQENSLWFPIVEKAWAFFRHHQGSYPSIESGDAPVDYPALGLGYTRYTTMPLGLAFEQTLASAMDLATQAKNHLAAGRPVVLSGPSGLNSMTSYAGGRTGEHVYTVDQVYTTAQGTFLKLRNPIGGVYVDIPVELAFARCIEMIVGTF